MRALEKAGVKCSLFDAYCLPLDCGPILADAKANSGTILTVEDNYTGGVYSELAEAAAGKGEIKVHGMTCPRVPKSGKTAEDILASLGLSTADIVARAKSLAR